jgi:hypothetical protein
VRTGQRPAAELSIEDQFLGRHALYLRRAFHVSQLARVEVAFLPAAKPAEEDVTRGLHQPLPGHDAVSVVLVDARWRVAFQYRRSRLLDLEEQRVVLAAALEQHNESPGAHAADPNDLPGHVHKVVPVEQVAPIVLQGTLVALPPSAQVIYTFIETEKANHRISRMCKVLRVSKSGFYSWRDREPSARAQADALLAEKIVRIHRDSRETYGAPRIHFELRTLGVRCARKRVARLMREAGLFGCGGRRRKARTTLRSRTERTPPAPDLVQRNFTPEAPDRLWVAEITYVRTWEGWLYLSFVLDTYSRRVLGWSMANNLRTELVLDALNARLSTLAGHLLD